MQDLLQLVSGWEMRKENRFLSEHDHTRKCSQSGVGSVPAGNKTVPSDPTAAQQDKRCAAANCCFRPYGI